MDVDPPPPAPDLPTASSADPLTTVPHAESSAHALSRARHRAHARLAPPLHAACRAAIHPSGPALLHSFSHASRLADGGATVSDGLGFSSLSTPAPPRNLTLPPGVPPPSHTWSTPCGRWLILFHASHSAASSNLPLGGSGPGLGTEIDRGGTLCVYPTGPLLSPLPDPGAVVPLLSLPLPQSPLALQPLFPSRLTRQAPLRRTPPLGPVPPVPLLPHPGKHGPTFLLLLPSGLLLFYPQYLPPAAPALAGGQGADGQWKMNFLRCPLHTRFRARMGELNPPDVPWRARRGWMGLVSGDEGVWFAYEREGEVWVVRADVGVDAKGAQYMEVVPMPPLPLPSRSPRGFSESTGSGRALKTTLQGVVFSALPKTEGQGRQGAGLSMIHHDLEGATSRTRLETISFERVPVSLSDAFNDIDSTSNEASNSWDWALHPSIGSSTSPEGISILAIHPLPSVAPYSLALALLALPGGHALTYLTLPTSPSADTVQEEPGSWTVGPLRRVDLALVDNISEAELVVTPGVEVGLLGLVAIVLPGSGVNPILVQPPPLPSVAETGGEVESSAEQGSAQRVAEAVVCAVRDQRGYGEVIRAGLSGVPQDERESFLTATLRHAHHLLLQENSLDAGSEMAKLQVAIFSSTGDNRLRVASTIVQMRAAARLFDECAIRGKSLSFSSQALFPLYNVTEYALNQLASVFLDLSLLSAEMEWSASDLPNPDAYPNLVLVSQPLLRRLLLGLLARVLAFKKYLESMRELPLDLAEGIGMGGSGGTADALLVVLREKGRALGTEQGLDIEAWGKALEASLHEPSPLSEKDQLVSFLSLRPGPLPQLQPLLGSLLGSGQVSTARLYMAQPHASDIYDAMTFLPLGLGDGASEGKRKVMVRCDRCGEGTIGGRTSLAGGQSTGVAADLGGGDGWARWVDERAEGCVCGGAWVRA